MVGGGFLDPIASPRRHASGVQLAALQGKAQEDQAEEGARVFLRLESGVARNWSAASHRRFSSALEAVSFSEGAIQCMGSRLIASVGLTGKWHCSGRGLG